MEGCLHPMRSALRRRFPSPKQVKVSDEAWSLLEFRAIVDLALLIVDNSSTFERLMLHVHAGAMWHEA